MLYAVVYDFTTGNTLEPVSLTISKKGNKVTAKYANGITQEFNKNRKEEYWDYSKFYYLKVKSSDAGPADITSCIVKAYKGMKVNLSNEKDCLCLEK